MMGTPLLLIVISTTLPILISVLHGINYYWDYVQWFWTPDVSTQLFDFIVVGAGSSGSVLAYRLAVQNYKVLLIEAGGDPILLNKIPGIALDLLRYKEHDWNYRTKKRDNVGLSHTNQEMYANRGKVLGGSSTLNYMFYMRGHPLDYDNWANITGDTSWNYENVLPYFKKSIYDYRGHFPENKQQYETSPYGFLTIDKIRFGKMIDSFFGAGEELGYTRNIDANGPQVEGLGMVESTQRNGERVSAYDVIEQNKNSLPNLVVSKYSHASKIQLDKHGNAVAVDFYRHGIKYTAKASKEIVVSAGAFDTPKLLMLSGIGPKKQLQSQKIKVKVDLPVGQNLQDHFGVLVLPFTTNAGTSFFLERDLGLGSFLEYFTTSSGILTSPTGVTAQFFQSSPKVGNRKWADIQTYLIPVSPSKVLAESFGRALSIKHEIFSEFMDPAEGNDGFTLLTILVRPKSRGEVTLRNKDHMSDPVIDQNPFSHPDDIEALTFGIRNALKLVETKSFQKIGAKFKGPHFSACKSEQFGSDSYWGCYIKHVTLNAWHPVGTCKMSHKDDPTAVVDPKLRVLGVKSLRVVDASVMPVIVNANTNAPCIMLGEKGADFILEHWAEQSLVCPHMLLGPDPNKCYYASRRRNFI